MMKTIAALILICGSAFGGEAQLTKEFVVRAKAEVVSTWLKEHPEDVAKATGGEIVSRAGNKVRVKQFTQKGIMDFTVNETNTVKGKVFSYSSNLIQVHNGLIEDQETKISVEEIAGGSKVTIYLYAEVKATTPVAIRTNLIKSARGFEEMVERKFR